MKLISMHFPIFGVNSCLRNKFSSFSFFATRNKFFGHKIEALFIWQISKNFFLKLVFIYYCLSKVCRIEEGCSTVPKDTTAALSQKYSELAQQNILGFCLRMYCISVFLAQTHTYMMHHCISSNLDRLNCMRRYITVFGTV